MSSVWRGLLPIFILYLASYFVVNSALKKRESESVDKKFSFNEYNSLLLNALAAPPPQIETKPPSTQIDDAFTRENITIPAVTNLEANVPAKVEQINASSTSATTAAMELQSNPNNTTFTNVKSTVKSSTTSKTTAQKVWITVKKPVERVTIDLDYDEIIFPPEVGRIEELQYDVITLQYFYVLMCMVCFYAFASLFVRRNPYNQEQ